MATGRSEDNGLRRVTRVIDCTSLELATTFEPNTTPGTRGNVWNKKLHDVLRFNEIPISFLVVQVVFSVGGPSNGALWDPAQRQIAQQHWSESVLALPVEAYGDWLKRLIGGGLTVV